MTGLSLVPDVCVVAVCSPFPTLVLVGYRSLMSPHSFVLVLEFRSAVRVNFECCSSANSFKTLLTN